MKLITLVILIGFLSVFEGANSPNNELTYSPDTARFDLIEYRDKFKYKLLDTFDLDTLDSNFEDLYQLNLTDYYNIYQEELHYRAVDINPYFLFSLQTEEKNFTSVAVFHYKEAVFTDIDLINFDSEGKKIGRKTIASKGGDSFWEFGITSTYSNDSEIVLKSYESFIEEETDSTYYWVTKKMNEQIKIDESGYFRTQSVDSTRTGEWRKF